MENIDQDFKRIFESKPSERISNLLVTITEACQTPPRSADLLAILQENTFWPSCEDIENGILFNIIITFYKIFSFQQTVFNVFIFLGEVQSLVSTYDISNKPPRFNISTTRSLLFPKKFLTYVFSKECFSNVEEKINDLVKSPEFNHFGLSKKFYLVEEYEMPKTDLKIDIGVAPFSDYEKEINNHLSLEKHFYIVLRYNLSEVDIPVSIARKRADTLKSLYENKKILTRLPLTEVMTYIYNK